MDAFNLQKVPLKRSVSCYFCSELFDESLLQSHIKQCGQVLEPCRYKCGVYVPRRAHEKHAQDCTVARRHRNRLSSGGYLDYTKINGLNSNNNLNSNNHQQYSPKVIGEPELRSKTLPNHNNYSPIRKSFPTDPTNILCQQTKAELDKVDITLRNQQQICRNNSNDITDIQKQQTDYFERIKEIESTITTLQLFQNDIAQKYQSEKFKTQLEFEKVQLKHELTDEWLKQLKTNIDSILNNITSENKKYDTISKEFNKFENKLTILDRYETEINQLHQMLYQDRKFHDTNFATLKDDFLGFKEYLTHENLLVSEIWNEQAMKMKKFLKYLKDIDEELKELSLKEHANSFEIKASAQLGQSCKDKITNLECDINILKKSFAQLRQDIDDLYTSERYSNNNCSIIHSTNGHIIWKITNYSSKLMDAKENDTVLHSPIFLTNPYGYKLRADAHLNGIGKWKDRHLIITIQILKGEWDSILDWPCHLLAAVILKDQNENRIEAVDLVKTLTVKKRLEDLKDELTENSCQHLFISHKVLNEYNYIKDDVVFFEIKIKNDTIVKK